VDATGPTADSLQNEPVVSQPSSPYSYSAGLIPNLAMRLAVWLMTQFTPDTESPDTLTPPAGEKWSSYYYAGGQRIAMRVQEPADPDDTNAVYYPLTDHLGSTSVTAYEDGTYYSELRYKPWGATRLTSGQTPTDFGYTGQRAAMIFLALPALPQPFSERSQSIHRQLAHKPLAHIGSRRAAHQRPVAQQWRRVGGGFRL